MKKWLFSTFLLFISCLPAYQVAIAAIFRDDANYLKEWIEYHHLLGVEHFYLYNNFSKDHYKQVLQPYIKKGIVELFEWKHSHKNLLGIIKMQTSAYNDALKRCKKNKTKWLAYIDTDEFLVPKNHDDLYTFLEQYDQYGGVVAFWQMFGDSGFDEIPEDKTLIESLLYRTPSNYNPQYTDKLWYPGTASLKSIVQPRYTKKMLSAHHAIYEKGFFSVNANRVPCTSIMDKNYTHDQIQINHYWCRVKNFIKTKIARSTSYFTQQEILGRYQHINDHATIRDEEVLRFVPSLRDRLSKTF